LETTVKIQPIFAHVAVIFSRQTGFGVWHGSVGPSGGVGSQSRTSLSTLLFGFDSAVSVLVAPINLAVGGPLGTDSVFRERAFTSSSSVVVGVRGQ